MRTRGGRQKAWTTLCLELSYRDQAAAEKSGWQYGGLKYSDPTEDEVHVFHKETLLGRNLTLEIWITAP